MEQKQAPAGFLCMVFRTPFFFLHLMWTVELSMARLRDCTHEVRIREGRTCVHDTCICVETLLSPVDGGGILNDSTTLRRHLFDPEEGQAS